MGSLIEIVSFGYNHPEPLRGTLNVVWDVRAFRNPLDNPTLQGLTGTDPRVIKYVMDTPDVAEFVIGAAQHLAAQHRMDTLEQRERTIRAAVGCGGGRHRAPAIAGEIGRLLRSGSIGTFLQDVTETHRDIGRDVARAGRQPFFT